MIQVFRVLQALEFALEGAQKFLSDKGQLYEENLILHWNFAKGTTAKAKGTTAIAVGAVNKWRPRFALYFFSDY